MALIQINKKLSFPLMLQNGTTYKFAVMLKQGCVANETETFLLTKYGILKKEKRIYKTPRNSNIWSIHGKSHE